ncbi:MAG: carbohydrate kinase family protein [Candidatus Saccharimonadales bacterium]
MTQKLEVLAVGDVVTDAFIKLANDQAAVEENPAGPKLVMPYAAKVPFDYTQIVPAVGNAANAAVAFSKLGLAAGLVSNVGDDSYGRQIMTVLEKAKVDTRFVHINSGKASNFHYVLWYKEDRTILIKHEDYDYHWPRFRAVDVPGWLYFSSVSSQAEDYHDQLAEWLQDHPDVKLAFQPGTFQIQAGPERLAKIYQRSEVLAVNRQEAAEISGGDASNINELFDRLHGLGPKIVVISDGHAGAYASSGQARYKMPIYPDPKQPFERTGAGDAFTSTFVAALIKGGDIESALYWAPINAMSVVQKVGAQAGLLDETEIDRLLRAAPENYRPARLEP